MLVGVLHTISDATAWKNALAEAEKTGVAPEGYGLPVAVHSGNGDYAFCLWSAPSVEALRGVLEPMTAGVATNTYFPVNTAHPGTNLPAGIPTQTINVTETPASTRS